MIVFENLDGFIGLLDQAQDKSIPVYVAKKNNVDEQMVLSGSILLQTRYDDDVASFSYTEHISPVQLVSTDSMLKISKVVDQSIMANIDNAVKNKINVFNTQLETEYNKAISMLQGKGFTNIVKASIM